MAEVKPKIIAFAGPCLPKNPDRVWQDLLQNIELWPPVQRGDVLLAMAENPDVLVLLDGFYYDVPAVTHKELLYALEAGVTVIGAASMGALRAVEMAPFGMVGVGKVFDLYQRGEIDGDDEVALLHAPADLGYDPMTIALVDLRHALRRLVNEGTILKELAEKLVDAVKLWPFMERTPQQVQSRAQEILGAPGWQALDTVLKQPGIKQRDAYEALKLAHEKASQQPEKPSAKDLDVSVFLSFFREWCLGPERSVRGADRVTYQHGWSAVQVLHPQAEVFVEGLRERFLWLSAARESGFAASNHAVAQRAELLIQHLDSSPEEIRLPLPEIQQEAEHQVLAEEFQQCEGDLESALEPLLTKLGLSTRGGCERLLDHLALQDDLMPQWWLIRSFLFSNLAPEALGLAAAAAEVERAFRHWSRGKQVTDQELSAMAQKLWGCSEEDVIAAAGRRGLFKSHGFAAGLEDALKRLVVAENLKRPVNDYPALRQLLLAKPVQPLLISDLSAVEKTLDL